MHASSLSCREDDSGDPRSPASDHLPPMQFVELFQRPSNRIPEVALMAAVLEDAILSVCRCAGSRGVRSQQLFQETAEWFASSDTSWPFAFENICDALALESDWIRGLLRRWQDNQPTTADRPVTIPSVRLRVAGSRHSVSGRAPGRRHPTVLRYSGTPLIAPKPKLDRLGVISHSIRGTETRRRRQLAK